MIHAFRSVLLIVGLFYTLTADDWPQFRGPSGQGHSSQRGLPLEWSETRNIVWKVPVPGRAWSSPVVEGERIWLTTAVDARPGVSLRVLAFHRNTGKLVHDIEVFKLSEPGPMHPKNSHASLTPVIEGSRVYVHFGAHGTAALTTSGEIVWKTRLPYNHLHGTAGSPVLYKDLLIISCDGVDVQYVAALDKGSGQIRWKTPRRGAMAYSTPLVIHSGGIDQVISPGGLRVIAYEPATGKEIWSVSYGDGFSNVPRPVYSNGLVFIGTGFNHPNLIAVRPDGQGDVTSSHVVWTERRSAPLTPSPVAVGDELYFVNDGGIASCVDARTGSLHWRERLGGNHSASPLYADGRIYFLNEDGESTVIQPGKAFRKLAVNKLDGSTLASMAVSNGSILIRSDSHLYRIENR